LALPLVLLAMVAACAPAAPTTVPTTVPTTAPAAPTAAPAKPAAAAAPTTAPAKPAAAPTSAAAPAAGKALDVVKFTTGRCCLSSSGILVAYERGYFREYGIDAQFQPIEFGSDRLAAIVAQQVAVANLDAGAFMFNAMGRDVPIRMVADGSHGSVKNDNMALVVRKDLIDSGAFKGIADLKGKKVTTLSPGSVLNIFLDDVLKPAGLTRADVQPIWLNSFADALAAFTNKALDAATLVEPNIQAAQDQNLGVRVRGWAEQSGPFQGTVIIYGPSMVGREDVGRRFMTGYLRGVRDYVDFLRDGKDREAIIDILIKHLAIKDRGTYGKVILPDYQPNGELFVDSLAKMHRWFLENKQVDKDFRMQDVIDNQYLEHAYSVLGKR
jgi:NitT/TauT family transport system substrate-binding protein